MTFLGGSLEARKFSRLRFFSLIFVADVTFFGGIYAISIHQIALGLSLFTSDFVLALLFSNPTCLERMSEGDK